MLTIASWPTIVAAIIGILSTHITDLLTHRGASDRLKSQVNLALVTLGSVIMNITTVDHNSLKKTLATIGVAWVMSLATHYADPLGTVNALQNSTAGTGLGDGSPKPESYAGVQVTESDGPPSPPSSPGMATQARQSKLKSPKGQPRQ